MVEKLWDVFSNIEVGIDRVLKRESFKSMCSIKLMSKEWWGTKCGLLRTNIHVCVVTEIQSQRTYTLNYSAT